MGKKWLNKTTFFILFTFFWIIYQNYRIRRLFYTPTTHWQSAIYQGAMASFNGMFHSSPLNWDHIYSCYPNYSILIYSGVCEEASGNI
jgi:hypothetical protein